MLHNFIGSYSYQGILDNYEIKRQKEFQLIKNRVNEITEFQQKASVDQTSSKQKLMTEDRKIEEYQDKLYIKEYTEKKSILFFICQIFILTHFNI